MTVYGLVDCNNFFVSCERVFRPALEGRPTVVLSSNDGCIVTCSDEAKALGIKMAQPAFQAKESHIANSRKKRFFSHRSGTALITPLMWNIEIVRRQAIFVEEKDQRPRCRTLQDDPHFCPC